jgi:hypothetical protein
VAQGESSIFEVLNVVGEVGSKGFPIEMSANAGRVCVLEQEVRAVLEVSHLCNMLHPFDDAEDSRVERQEKSHPRLLLHHTEAVYWDTVEVEYPHEGVAYMSVKFVYP